MSNLLLDKNSSLPIGIFDSGIGGLTVLAALQKIMPHENFLYIGDNARLPYGTKSPQTVIRYAKQLTAALVKRKIKLLVIACNTASAAAFNSLCADYPNLPIVGVIEPGAKAACETSKTGNIAIIGTASTIKTQAYQDAIYKINPAANIIAKACPLFVPMAEEGLISGHLVEEIIEHYLSELFPQQLPKERNITPDCLILGCTHFPLLKDAIQKVIGQHVNIVDPAAATALLVQKLVTQSDFQGEKFLGKGKTKFFTTDDAEHFALMGQFFLGKPLPAGSVELIDL